jgi:hypothetical protein
MESLEFELEEGVGADEKASHLWHSEVEKCMKEMSGKKVTEFDGVHFIYSDLWEKIFSNQSNS